MTGWPHRSGSWRRHPTATPWCCSLLLAMSAVKGTAAGRGAALSPYLRWADAQPAPWRRFGPPPAVSCWPPARHGRGWTSLATACHHAHHPAPALRLPGRCKRKESGRTTLNLQGVPALRCSRKCRSNCGRALAGPSARKRTPVLSLCWIPRRPRPEIFPEHGGGPAGDAGDGQPAGRGTFLPCPQGRRLFPAPQRRMKLLPLLRLFAIPWWCW